MKRIAFILFVSIWPALLTAQELFPKTNGKGAWGFCDANGAWVIKPKAKYELVRSFSEGFAQVTYLEYVFIICLTHYLPSLLSLLRSPTFAFFAALSL